MSEERQQLLDAVQSASDALNAFRFGARNRAERRARQKVLRRKGK